MFDNKTRSIVAIIITILAAVFGLPQLGAVIDNTSIQPGVAHPAG